MNAWFRQLFTVAITNSYYGTIPSDDFDFIVPADTARRLAGAKLVARASGDRLNVLYAAEDTVAGEALIPAPGTVLRFGLRLKNLKFQNFTEVAFDPKVAPPVYRNLTLPAALDAPTPTVILAGSVLSHTLTDATRPVTVYLRDSANRSVADKKLETATQATVSFEVAPLTPGAYTLDAVHPAANPKTLYYVDSELLAAGVYGIIEIKIDSSFYSKPPTFTIAFAARKQPLKYYVVATGYSAIELAKLTVTDPSPVGGAAPLVFTPIAQAAFDKKDDIAPSLLVRDVNDQVVLFKSKTEVPRSAKGRAKLQLKKNGDVLISNLPTPSAEQSSADFFVKLSNPTSGSP